ncbi:hypothetical protein EF513_06835 [Rickettsiales endosymbiont of Stachyamoeba lipophora]|nr:hypothetical protein EF513_06835 [Rickettsiales endosymbiont of Stachyamoeba lipophora]
MGTLATEQHLDKKDQSIVIAGAGPVGSLTALLMGSCFPNKDIIVLEKRIEYGRKHGLNIWNSTITDVNSSISQIERDAKKSLKAAEKGGDQESITHFQTLLDNTSKAKQFLKKNFQGELISKFIATNKISQMLEDKAVEIGNGRVKFLKGEQYALTDESLAEAMGNKTLPAELERSELQKILANAEMIIGADGAHSKVREQVFKEPEPQTEVIQHLIEIKLDLNKNTTPASSKLQIVAKTIGDFLSRTILPTLETGKLNIWTEGKEKVATLHILVNEDVYNELRNNKGSDGKEMGTLQNPYSSLKDLPEGEAKKIIEKGIYETIGAKNIVPGSLKIATIPMQVYKAKEMVTVKNNKLFNIIGDAAVGLIFIRGVNNGLQAAGHLTKSTYEMVKNREKSTKLTELPKEMLKYQQKELAVADQKMNGIRRESKALILVKMAAFVLSKPLKAIKAVIAKFSKKNNQEIINLDAQDNKESKPSKPPKSSEKGLLPMIIAEETLSAAMQDRLQALKDGNNDKVKDQGANLINDLNKMKETIEATIENQFISSTTQVKLNIDQHSSQIKFEIPNNFQGFLLINRMDKDGKFLNSKNSGNLDILKITNLTKNGQQVQVVELVAEGNNGNSRCNQLITESKTFKESLMVTKRAKDMEPDILSSLTQSSLFQKAKNNSNRTM